jgi:hypothetical protein
VQNNQQPTYLNTRFKHAKKKFNTRFKRAPTCNHNSTTKSAQQMASDEVGGEKMKDQLHLAPSSVLKKQACENRGSTRTEAVPEPAASSQLSGEVAFSPEAKSKPSDDVAFTMAAPSQLSAKSSPEAPTQLSGDVTFSPAAPHSRS